ncbi:arginine--tRNA ligase [Mycoplasmopsis gallinacea]|uniref:Arginine--tRNA ligase n=1 Tax=Mycoplasmopsis gallinacea TaxID=29556 RepID=A0A449A3P4_9BACT|nr:arginine--tRNA ligase [Mycoplasmopsis gallinacea]VEU58900.1 Arginyl-tRNA synthetase [Mycoplasmopsis gallinacea]
MSINLVVKKELIKAVESLQEQGFFEQDFNANELVFDLSESNVPEQSNPDKIEFNLSSNIAFIVKKYVKNAPVNIANAIKECLKDSKVITYVSVTMPGFLNFVINDELFIERTFEINDLKDSYGGNFINKEKVNIEFVSANPTGFLHVGHARGAAVGDSLVRMYRHAGYDVEAEYYVNDAGNQIDTLAASVHVRYLALFGTEKPMPEECYRGNDIIWCANKIKDLKGDYFNDYELSEAKYQELKLIATEIMLAQIMEHLKEFRVSFDTVSSERAVRASGAIEQVLNKLKDNTYTQDGALFLNTTQYGDDKDRVLIKNDGSFTYLLPDIAYHANKFAQNPSLINVWGADHSGYVLRMKIAMQLLGFNKENLDILTIQLVRLIKDGQEFKMSKRAGTSVTLADLMDNSSVDAIRYTMLTREVNSKFDFDIDEANSDESNSSVFIVQYAHSRACSLLSKMQAASKQNNAKLTLKAKKVIRALDDFEELIKTIVSTKKVNLMTQYLSELAKLFNSFYAETKLINHEFESTYASLVLAVKNVLSLGLELIGVSAPTEM